MAKVTMTTTVNTQTGAPINTFTVTAGDIIKAVVLRTKLSPGAYGNKDFSLALTIADGSQATATIPGWVPLIVLVAIGGLILSLVAVFGGKQ